MISDDDEDGESDEQMEEQAMDESNADQEMDDDDDESKDDDLANGRCIHADNGMVYCAICPNPAGMSREQFQKHWSFLHQLGKCQCDECPAILHTQYQLAAHKAAKHDRFLSCANCPMTFPDLGEDKKNQMRYRLRDHTQTCARYFFFACDHCEKQNYYDLSTANRHTKGNDRLNCDIRRDESLWSCWYSH